MRAKLYIPNPPLQSKIASLIVALEPLRNRALRGTTPAWVFFELKDLFQIIESVTSTRIEGNHTTVADFVEAVREKVATESEGEEVKEIENVSKGIQFIEELQSKDQLKIDRDFLLRIHRIVIDGLDPNREGDSRPGAYRNRPIRISGSDFRPPPPSDVDDFMNKLIEFINAEVEPQLDLLKIAVVHHRFVWIHPFRNGNGRVVRLLTYAMLVKSAFIDATGTRLLDPSSVFGKSRTEYYRMLSAADDCSDEGLLKWSEYLLEGLKNEVNKIDRLLDEGFTKTRIIIPALEYALEKKRINDLEFRMLVIAVNQKIVKASNFAGLFPGVSRVNISLAIRKLKEQRLLRPMGENSRRYTPRFTRNALTLGIMLQLDKENFLPEQSQN